MVLNPQAREKVWLPVRNANCELCPLHKDARTVCLLGDGPVPSKIMLVGEAPGAREDDTERPFSGVAGQYLDRILGEVGLPRDSVYITNAVRCRPPDNRTPTKPEIKACADYMQRELQIVDPTFVLLLGNSALLAFTGKTGIMAKRGAPMDIGGRVVFPTIHPAAVLRNPAHEGIFKADLLSFARLVAGTRSRPETQSALVQTSKGLAKLCDMLASVDDVISFDVETGTKDMVRDEGGLEPWAPDGVIHTVAFSWLPKGADWKDLLANKIAGKSYVVSLEHPATQWDIPIERVYSALAVALQGKRMVGHNVKFDCEWMDKKGAPLYAHFDTKLAAHLLDENRPGGLKPLARTYLGADNYEEGVSFTSVTPLPKLAIYNGKDADYTLRLYYLFREDLKKRPKLARLFLSLVMPACRAFTELEKTGFPIDMERLRSRHLEIKTKIKGIEDELLAMVPEDRRHLANWSSSALFMGWFLFDHLKLPIILVTKTGRRSTAENVLLQLRRKHPAVDKIMELRKWQKYESTYTRNWLTRVGVARKPRLYTSYNLSGTVTGRLSANMQQVPRDVFIRSIIGTRPGWKFIEADFAQIELRIAAMFSRDKALTKAFKTGGDPHLETAVRILKKRPEDITKEERKLAKAVNFGFLYGMWWKKFRTYADEKFGVQVSIEEAKAYRIAFFAQYSALPAWHERQRRLVRNLGQVQSPTGRIRHLPTILSTDEEVQAEAERQAINSPVQGFAGDLTVLAMVILQKKLDPSYAKIIGNVHDSIMLQVRDDHAQEVADLVKHTMEHLPLKKLFDFVPNVPIAADVTISQHWGEK